MQQLREQIRRIAQHDTWVLISGEQGSGKHQCARYLHANSTRSNGPFIEVGVASMSSEQSAVELFGTEIDGTVHYGRLEQANAGILFLDDIADMDLATQGKLVSALESGSFLRIGGNEPVAIDVRVIASTRHDLQQRVSDSVFRDDLYYQLNVVPLKIPPLREHSEDISELLNFLIDQFVTQEHLTYRSFSVAAQNRLRNYTWPGNIRELQNLVQRVLIIGGDGQVELDEIESMLSTEVAKTSGAVSMPPVFDLPLREAREAFEKAYLEHRLKEAGGSVGKVAKLAEMERTHLYRKLRALGIDPKKVAAGENSK